MTCGACAPSSGSTECEHEGVFIYNDDVSDGYGTETGVCTKCGQTITRKIKIDYTGGGYRYEIVLQGYGTDEDKVVYTKMIKAFNNSLYAHRNNLSLRMTQFLAEQTYVQGIESGNTLSSDNKVDIIFVNDRYLKKWANAGFVVPLPQKHSSMLDGMYSGLKSSYRYNKNGATSDEDDPLWGVPVAASSTAVYYNRRAMENAGVIVISVADDMVTEANFVKLAAMYAGLTEDMVGKNLLDLWNQNKIADKFGQYRDACGNRDGKTNSGAGRACEKRYRRSRKGLFQTGLRKQLLRRQNVGKPQCRGREQNSKGFQRVDCHELGRTRRPCAAFVAGKDK